LFLDLQVGPQKILGAHLAARGGFAIGLGRGIGIGRRRGAEQTERHGQHEATRAKALETGSWFCNH
jgi:hypothetical protein